MKDKLTVVLRALNFIKPYYTLTLKENYKDFTSVQKDQSYSRDFGLSVTYRFGNLKATMKKAIRSIENGDVKEGRK